MLVDGNSLTYRAFFALPTDLATASGQVTNAVYGFTSMLINLLRDHQPDAVAVAFDRPEPTFRHEAIEDYKANRTEAPDILRQQLGLVREVVETLGFPLLEKPGVEADDIIATLATAARDRGDDVLVVTGDRDSYQLVEDPHVKVLYNKRGVSDYALYDEAGIRERTGVVPADYVAYAALRGDPSDNLPGVPGVGEKTAAKLINTYGDLDGVFAHVEDQTPKLRANLAEHEERVRRNAEVMVLQRQVELDADLDDLQQREIDAEALRTLFDFLEFHSLGDRLADALAVSGLGAFEAGGDGVEELTASVRTPVDASDAASWLREAGTKGAPATILAGWEGETSDQLSGLAVVLDTAAGTVGWIPAGLLDIGEVVGVLAELAGDTGRLIATHDAKPFARWLLGRDIDLRGLALDTMLAAYLLDPGESGYRLEDLLGRYARRSLPADVAPADGQLALGVDAVDVGKEVGTRALAIGVLVDPLHAALDAQGLRALNDDVEVPLVRVLARMEHLGVGIDVEELRALHQRLGAEVDELTRQIHEDAGEEFKINSVPQLRSVLYEKLRLAPKGAPAKRTKTGLSTDATALEKLKGQHPIVEHLLRYREVEKLRSTYGEGLLAEVAPDGRIHATFNQTVARTGRLSSDRPNLHNIPARTEEGRAFRQAFVPATGYDFLVADYNQIELRCIAHLARDPGLIAAFEAATDIHTETAARVFDVDPTAVTVEQRSKAKMVSYGLAYGMEAYGLGQRLAIPTADAQVILDAYFDAFPSVRAYMEQTVAEARARGYTETLFGRRRHIPELSSSNFRIRQAGERQAMNAGIQGLAADIFKVALVRLDRALDDRGLRSRLVLQVHDEVLLEVPPDEHEIAAEVTLTAMRGAYDLEVPLEVRLSFGASWADAK
jgi:DNA polymerase-1